MAFCNRTLAIKAALGAGFLLILLNLLNSKFDSTTAPNGYSRYGATHWPKRTHASLEKQSLTTTGHSAENIDGRKVNATASEHNDAQQINNGTTSVVDPVQNQSWSTTETNLSQSDEKLRSLVTIRVGKPEPEDHKEEQNVIENFKNNSTNRITVPSTVEMVSNKTANNNSTNTLSITDGRSRYSDRTRTISSAQKENPVFGSDVIATHNTRNRSSKIVESLTALPVKQDALASVPTQVGDISKSSSNSNRVEGTVRSFADKFTINSCPPIPPNLDGPIEVDVTYEALSVLEMKFADKLQPGGQYAPPDCLARNRVAIIVPYRDREQHLPIFLKNIHALLMKQQLEYGIYIVEQTTGSSFNRAALMNIGFVEAMKQKNWECMVFHDIDLLPMDDRNLYTCPDQPRHMSVAVDTFSFKLPYNTIFGGVSAMTEKQFRTVNGFSNSFWGWGGEDDDMSNRLKHVGFHIARYPVNIARYTMLNHKKEKANPKRYEKLVNGAKRYDSDGLNSLHYQLVNLIRKPLYTWIHVDITPDGS